MESVEVISERIGVNWKKSNKKMNKRDIRTGWDASNGC